jgi:hypothetical protein
VNGAKYISFVNKQNTFVEVDFGLLTLLISEKEFHGPTPARPESNPASTSKIRKLGKLELQAPCLNVTLLLTRLGVPSSH